MRTVHNSPSSADPGIEATFISFCQEMRRRYVPGKKALLVQSPQFLFDTFKLETARARGYYAFPPVGLLWLKKELMALGWEVRILDLNYEILRRINAGGWDIGSWPLILDECLAAYGEPFLVGVTGLSVGMDILASTHPLTSVLRYFQRRNRSVVIAGGPVATNEFGRLLAEGLCQVVVTGEGENKVRYLAGQLQDDRSGQTMIPGIHYVWDGQVLGTGGHPDTVQPRGNLIAVYQDISVEKYCQVGSLNPFSRMAGQDRAFATFQFNRGCRADCQFCGVTQFMGRGLRQFPVADVVEEMWYLIRERGIRHFEVLDDDFLGTGAEQEGVRALLTEMVRMHREYGTSWAAGNGLIAASIDNKIMGLIRDSGCVGFRMGIETGDEAMLRKLKKPATLNKIREVSRLLRQYPEVFVGGNFIIGLLGKETFGEMLQTLRFGLEIDLDWFAVTTFQFTSEANARRKEFTTDGKGASDFIPTRDKRNDQLPVRGQAVSGALDVFDLSLTIVPDREQIRDIWFAFNFLMNYVFNKNLKPGGRPEKFVAWVDALSAVYPDNAGMPFFSSLAYVVLGKSALAGQRLEKTKQLLQGSTYWQGRFEQFFLKDVLDAFPGDPSGVFQAMDRVRRQVADHVPLFSGGCYERV